MVAGSWRFVVVSLIQPSMQDTSSSVRLSVGLSVGLLSGGSIELQHIRKKGRIKKFNKNSL